MDSVVLVVECDVRSIVRVWGLGDRGSSRTADRCAVEQAVRDVRVVRGGAAGPGSGATGPGR